MLKTTHGITPLRFRVGLIKFRTSIKPGNPTLWQDPSVRSNLNYYTLSSPPSAFRQLLTSMAHALVMVRNIVW